MKNPLDFWRGTNSLSPFNEIQKMMDQMWGEFPTETNNALTTFAPTGEVEETNTEYIAKFELPGLEKDQIKVDLHDNRLTVSGERKVEKKNEDKHTHFSEFSYGSFTRSFSLPKAVSNEKAEANFENGILTVRIPKEENTSRREISIK